MLIAIILAAVLLLVAIISVVAIVNSNSDKNGGETGTETVNTYKNTYPSATKVGYDAEYLGTVERNIPKETKDEGLVANGTITAYPTYGTNMSYTTEQKNAILEESKLLCSTTPQDVSGTFKGIYDQMDENGYLYVNGEPVLDDAGNQRQLYKHTASTSMYYGTGVSDGHYQADHAYAARIRQLQRDGRVCPRRRGN
jgi:uncharacterized membrane protein